MSCRLVYHIISVMFIYIFHSTNKWKWKMDKIAHVPLTSIICRSILAVVCVLLGSVVTK